MMFNVPQFIDVEDKIAGPLTVKQLLWMIGMGAVLLVTSLFLKGKSFYVMAVPTVMLFILLAFYKPNGMPLIMYFLHGIFFLFRPKIMMWRRSSGGGAFTVRTGRKKPEKEPDREASRPKQEDFRRIAEMVDHR